MKNKQSNDLPAWETDTQKKKEAMVNWLTEQLRSLYVADSKREEEEFARNYVKGPLDSDEALDAWAAADGPEIEAAEDGHIPSLEYLRKKYPHLANLLNPLPRAKRPRPGNPNFRR